MEIMEKLTYNRYCALKETINRELKKDSKIPMAFKAPNILWIIFDGPSCYHICEEQKNNFLEAIQEKLMWYCGFPNCVWHYNYSKDKIEPIPLNTERITVLALGRVGFNITKPMQPNDDPIPRYSSPGQHFSVWPKY